MFVALVVGAAFAFFVSPRTGQIAINVSDAKGARVGHPEIFVDGKKQCDSAPCVVAQVTSGPHTVHVVADGYEPPADKAVAVEWRSDTTVDFMLSPSAASGTGLKVSGNQAGAKLIVDDKEVGPLPQELHDMVPGSHRVRVSAGERYAAVERNVTIAKDEFQDLGSVTLKVVKGKATVTLGTPGAKVYIVSGSDRRELPALPISVDIDTSKQWSLVATRYGYNDYNQPISFDDGQAEKSFNVTLDVRQSAPVAAAPPQPVAARPAAPQPPPTPPPPATSDNTSASSASNSSASSGSGGDAFLNINSIPASSIVLDGKPIGNTPKLRYSVSPGSHTVLFVNAEQGFKKQISVSVGAGETKPAIGKN
jgi:serine/threonine-protein kinase